MAKSFQKNIISNLYNKKAIPATPAKKLRGRPPAKKIQRTSQSIITTEPLPFNFDTDEFNHDDHDDRDLLNLFNGPTQPMVPATPNIDYLLDHSLTDHAEEIRRSASRVITTLTDDLQTQSNVSSSSSSIGTKLITPPIITNDGIEVFEPEKDSSDDESDANDSENSSSEGEEIDLTEESAPTNQEETEENAPIQEEKTKKSRGRAPKTDLNMVLQDDEIKDILNIIIKNPTFRTHLFRLFHMKEPKIYHACDAIIAERNLTANERKEILKMLKIKDLRQKRSYHKRAAKEISNDSENAIIDGIASQSAKMQIYRLVPSLNQDKKKQFLIWRKEETDRRNLSRDPIHAMKNDPNTLVFLHNTVSEMMVNLNRPTGFNNLYIQSRYPGTPKNILDGIGVFEFSNVQITPHSFFWTICSEMFQEVITEYHKASKFEFLMHKTRFIEEREHLKTDFVEPLLTKYTMQNQSKFGAPTDRQRDLFKDLWKQIDPTLCTMSDPTKPFVPAVITSIMLRKHQKDQLPKIHHREAYIAQFLEEKEAGDFRSNHNIEIVTIKRDYDNNGVLILTTFYSAPVEMNKSYLVVPILNGMETFFVSNRRTTQDTSNNSIVIANFIPLS